MEIEVNHIAGLIAPGCGLQGRRHVQLVPKGLRNLHRDKNKFTSVAKTFPRTA